jgi:hypothetical protein
MAGAPPPFKPGVQGRGRTRSGLGKFVLGSVAEAMTATTSKPALTLSEAEERVPADEKTSRQPAYLTRVLWNRWARGLDTHVQVQNELIGRVESESGRAATPGHPSNLQGGRASA